MRLRANVRRVTDTTRHLADGSELPPIAYVEIEPADDAFYLLYFSATGECLTDTWHQTLAQAQAQARAEFEIEDADWEDVSLRLL